MMRQILTIGIVIALSLLAPSHVSAADAPSKPAAPAVDEAMQTKIDAKTKRLLEAAKLDDPAKVEKVKPIIGAWLVAMWDWHKQHDPELARLWSDWSKARAVVPK